LGRDSAAALEALEAELQITQDKLSAAVTSRNSGAFELLLRGSGGASFFYDLWRQIKALVNRQPLEINHSNVK
jgi:hypothetical protein